MTRWLPHPIIAVALGLAIEAATIYVVWSENLLVNVPGTPPAFSMLVFSSFGLEVRNWWSSLPIICAIVIVSAWARVRNRINDTDSAMIAALSYGAMIGTTALPLVWAIWIAHDNASVPLPGSFGNLFLFVGFVVGVGIAFPLARA